MKIVKMEKRLFRADNFLNVKISIFKINISKLVQVYPECKNLIHSLPSEVFVFKGSPIRVVIKATTKFKIKHNFEVSGFAILHPDDKFVKKGINLAIYRCLKKVCNIIGDHWKQRATGVKNIIKELLKKMEAKEDEKKN